MDRTAGLTGYYILSLFLLAIYSERVTFMKLERDFQKDLIKEIKSILPGCFVLKQDAGYKQGIPDLLILYGKKWAALECKKSASATKRPNQDYYVETMNKMSFASIIFPENKEEVLHDLQQALKPGRKTRASGSK